MWLSGWSPTSWDPNAWDPNAWGCFSSILAETRGYDGVPRAGPLYSGRVVVEARMAAKAVTIEPE